MIPIQSRKIRKASPIRGRNRKLAESGYSLAELMVAVTIGLIVLAGLTAIFVNSIRSRTEIERTGQQIDNGRFAMQLLADDLRNAGYLAEFNPASLPTPLTKPDACATDLAALRAALPLAVQGYDNGVNAPTCLSDLRPGTDILVIRRASTCAVGEANCDAQVNGIPYFQASGCSNVTELSSVNTVNYYALDSNVANLTMHQRDCTTLASYRQYRVHIYFVANNDKRGDRVPTLKRAELGASGFIIVPLVEGVESLQIEYGLDTPASTTGAPAAFTANPDSYNACGGAGCISYWRNVVTAKVNVLARNTTVTPGWNDSKAYNLGLNADNTNNTLGPFYDGFKRHVYAATVRLNNTSGRNTP
jgi:type IV pilus assembly protein PilW